MGALRSALLQQARLVEAGDLGGELEPVEDLPRLRGEPGDVRVEVVADVVGAFSSFGMPYGLVFQSPATVVG